jgi:long-chain acyl-CoA synthetase
MRGSASLSHLPDLGRYGTTVRLLRHNAERHAGDTAMREKESGIWQSYTWRDYQDHVRHIALGLVEIGVTKGSVVALIGDNRPHWVWGEVAAHACGAMSLGVYRDALEEEVAYLVNYAECKVVLAEDEEQVDKLLNLGGKLPSVRTIIYADPRGMRKYDDPRLIGLTELEELGKRADAADTGRYDRMVDAVKPTDIAMLCTTSGTTANPKLAMLSHIRFLSHCRCYAEADPKGPDDEYVSALPLPWVMEQTYVIGWGLVARMKVNFPEEPETVMHDLREIGPTFILYAPRLWEQIAADVRSNMMDASRLKQRLFDLGMRIGLNALKHGKRSAFADFILFRALRDRLGFSRLKSAATGGAALGPETYNFFLAMGVPLRQLYGQTEAVGAYTLTRKLTDCETVGYPFDGVEVKIKDPDSEGVGEILVRHPNMTEGYFRNEKDTRELLDANGWLQSGDAGYKDKDRLIVIDRINDLATTARGIRFSPQYIENKLKFSPYIAEAVILGANRDYLVAMICIRLPAVAKWAEKNRIAFTTYSDLSARAEVYDLLQREVEKVNQRLPETQRVGKFLLLYKELDADDGELTRTRKVRRAVIAEKYAKEIDTLYSDRDSVDIDTEIRFQDGSKQRIVTTLRVVKLDPGGPAPALAAE